MGLDFANGGTQNFPGKIIQMKAATSNTEVQLTSSGYFWGSGGSGSGHITFDMTDTSNKLIVVGSLFFGRCNLNGGIKLIVNGDHNDGSGNRYWSGETSSAFSGGSSSSNGAFLTPDDSLGCSHEYGIGCVSVIRQSAVTMPNGTFYLGWYYYMGGNGEVNFNRQDNDNGGSASSSMIIYEVEDLTS